MLTIDLLQTTYVVSDRGAETETLRTRLDRVAREAVAAEIAPLLGRLHDDGAVYRIRALNLDLWIDASRHSDRQIARQLAVTIATQIAQCLARPGADGVMRYASHAEYLAAFFVDLLAGRAWTRWMYAEFDVLRDLPVGTVIAQIIGPRPELLGQVVAHVDQRGVLPNLLQCLTENDALAIWSNLPGAGATTPMRVLTEREITALAEAVARLSADSTTRDRRVTALHLLVWSSLIDPDHLRQPVFVGACEHAATFISRLTGRTPDTPVRDAVGTYGTTGEERLMTLLEERANSGDVDWQWLRAVTQTSIGHRYIRQVAQAVVEPSKSEHPTASLSNGLEVLSIESSWAGLALLIPTFREYGRLTWPGVLEPTAICQVLWEAGENVHDPILIVLSGVPENELDATLASDVAWPTDSAASRAAVAGLILERFASRLHGFAGSSPGYLRTQFLHRRGAVTVTETEVHVSLTDQPLAIVLRMAGYDGDQGAIAWLGARRLFIHLPGG